MIQASCCAAKLCWSNAQLSTSWSHSSSNLPMRKHLFQSFLSSCYSSGEKYRFREDCWYLTGLLFMAKRKSKRDGEHPWHRLCNDLTARAFFGELKSGQTEGTWLSNNLAKSPKDKASRRNDPEFSISILKLIFYLFSFQMSTNEVFAFTCNRTFWQDKPK